MGNIQRTAHDLLAPGRGILVADEYVARTLDRARPGIRDTGDCAAHDYLRVALDTWGLESYLTGVLMTRGAFEATERQRSLRQYRDGAPPLLHGVRMDPAVDRAPAGADFAEWRANLDPLTVGPGSVHVDAAALARGAAASQAEGVLPVVTVAMPDLASHSVAVTRAVTANALRALFDELDRRAVALDGLVLRTNMVVPGDRSGHRPAPAETALSTVTLLEEVVPAEVAGVAFLSGGQEAAEAAANLASLRELARERRAPWRLTFAYTRALVQESVATWACDGSLDAETQRELVRSCRLAAQALSGTGRAASA